MQAHRVTPLPTDCPGPPLHPTQNSNPSLRHATPTTTELGASVVTLRLCQECPAAPGSQCQWLVPEPAVPTCKHLFHGLLRGTLAQGRCWCRENSRERGEFGESSQNIPVTLGFKPSAFHHPSLCRGVRTRPVATTTLTRQCIQQQPCGKCWVSPVPSPYLHLHWAARSAEHPTESPATTSLRAHQAHASSRSRSPELPSLPIEWTPMSCLIMSSPEAEVKSNHPCAPRGGPCTERTPTGAESKQTS